MFLSDTFPMWLLLFVVQPALGPQCSQWSGCMATTVNFLICSSLVINAYMRPSRLIQRCSLELAVGSDIDSCSKNEIACRGDLTELFTVLTLCVLISLCWVGAQHYTLSMAVTLPLVPLLCAAVACGICLDVLDTERSLLPVPVPACTVPSSLGLAAEGAEVASDHIPVSKQESVVSSQTSHDKNDYSGVDINAPTSAPTATRSIFVSDSVREECSLHLSARMRMLCRCFLVVLCCACTPSGASTVVFCLKELLHCNPPHQSIQTSSSYFTALAADWINAEVPTLNRFLCPP